MWEFLKFKIRCWRKQNFMEVTNSVAGVYVNVYIKGEIKDSEIFWSDESYDDKVIDKCITGFQRQYEITKVTDDRKDQGWYLDEKGNIKNRNFK